MRFIYNLNRVEKNLDLFFTDRFQIAFRLGSDMVQIGFRLGLDWVKIRLR